MITPTPAHENNAYEFYQVAPDGATVVMTSLGVVLADREASYGAAINRLEAATEEIMSRKPQSIIQAGVPLIAFQGWGFEDEVLGKIRNVTDTPAATDLGSCIKGMQALGIKRPAMLTPFDPKTHDKLTDYVAHAGIEVSGVKSILDEMPGGQLRGYEVSTMDLGAVLRIGTQLGKDTPSADGIWITGALMPSVSVIESLERESGLPVIGSMQVMAWQALRLAGVTDKIDGFGRLLREF
jgi:maleate isomerase